MAIASLRGKSLRISNFARGITAIPKPVKVPAITRPDCVKNARNADAYALKAKACVRFRKDN